MIIRRVWGFGGLMVTNGIDEVIFPFAITEVSFQQITETLDKDDGGIYTYNKGFHCNIKTEILNVDANDYLLFRYLIQMLDYAIRNNTTLKVYPNYDTEQVLLINYDMICLSDVSMINETRSGAFQSLKLEWQTKKTIHRIPDWVENPIVYYWPDHEGNNIVDHDGNKIILAE